MDAQYTNDAILNNQENTEVGELFAEELPEQTDLVTPLSTWGSFGSFGSVGTISGTASTGSSVGTASSFGSAITQ